MNIKTLLGNKIKYLRKQKNISQEYLSELLDMNPRQIVRIENGESFPTAENLEKIANAFEIPVQELFYNDSFMKDNQLKDAIISKINSLDKDKLRAVYLMVTNI